MVPVRSQNATSFSLKAFIAKGSYLLSTTAVKVDYIYSYALVSGRQVNLQRWHEKLVHNYVESITGSQETGYGIETDVRQVVAI